MLALPPTVVDTANHRIMLIHQLSANCLVHGSAVWCPQFPSIHFERQITHILLHKPATEPAVKYLQMMQGNTSGKCKWNTTIH